MSAVEDRLLGYAAAALFGAFCIGGVLGRVSAEQEHAPVCAPTDAREAKLEALLLANQARIEELKRVAAQNQQLLDTMNRSIAQ